MIRQLKEGEQIPIGISRNYNNKIVLRFDLFLTKLDWDYMQCRESWTALNLIYIGGFVFKLYWRPLDYYCEYLTPEIADDD